MEWCLLKGKCLAFPMIEPTWTMCFGPYGSMGSLNMNLTHWGLVTPYGVMNFDNIGSCNGLSPDDIKPLLDPKLIDIINVKKVSVHNFQNVIRSQWVNLLAREKMANFSKTIVSNITLIENMLISTKIKQICYSGPIDKNYRWFS